MINEVYVFWVKNQQIVTMFAYSRFEFKPGYHGCENTAVLAFYSGYVACSTPSINPSNRHPCNVVTSTPSEPAMIQPLPLQPRHPVTHQRHNRYPCHFGAQSTINTSSHEYARMFHCVSVAWDSAVSCQFREQHVMRLLCNNATAVSNHNNNVYIYMMTLNVQLE